MKAIIIDDEASARSVLRLLIKEHIPEVAVAAEAGSYETALEALQTTASDILFLDIDLGTHSGFDVLDHLGSRTSSHSIIFVTSYSEHAVRAFRYAAVDYLLKPIDPEELINSVEKVKSKAALFSMQQLRLLKEELLVIQTQNNARRNVIVKGYNGSALIPTEEILYCKGDGSYTKIVKKDGSTVTASRPLIHFEEQLVGIAHFVRVHKSYIANMNEVKFISKKEDSQICFNNGICIPITNYKDVWDLLE